MKSELGVFVGKDLGLSCPKGVSYLQAVCGVGGAEFAGLDEEGEESGDEEEQGDWIGGSEAEHCSLWYLRRQVAAMMHLLVRLRGRMAKIAWNVGDERIRCASNHKYHISPRGAAGIPAKAMHHLFY